MAALSGTAPAPSALRALAALADAVDDAAGVLLGVVARLGSLLLGGRALRRVYLGPLWQRSRVLRGASAALHAAPVSPRVGGGIAGGLVPEIHTLDVTVWPGVGARGVERWRPEDLALVAPGAHPGRPEEDDEVGWLIGVQVRRNGVLEPADGRPLYGPQRLRLHVAFRPGARQFHFRYYLELLQRVSAPD
jgi:hypothetical protein